MALAYKDKNGEVSAKAGLSLSFTGTSNQGDFSGKLAIGVKLSEAPLCTVCGKNYAGQESLKQSLQGCGSLSEKGPATVMVAADGDEDGISTFSHTDVNMTINGTMEQIGKTITCVIDAGSVTNLETALEATILAECGVVVDVTIDEQACAGKAGTGGSSLSFAFGVDLTAFQNMVAVGTGKSDTKGNFPQQ